MIRIILFLFISGLELGCVMASGANIISKQFEIYHDINWINQPADIPLTHLPDFNLSPNSGVYWRKGDDINIDDPSEAVTKRYVMGFDYAEQRYINIEHLPYKYTETTVEQQLNTVRKLSMILQWVNAQRPDIEIGIFAMTVEKGFFTLENAPQAYLDRNQRFKSLAEYSDIVYLNLYTWWVDRHDKWSEALQTSVQQARLTGKKIIVFLWPHYQSPEANGQLIPGGEWRAQLEESYILTDGVIIWDKKTCDWQDLACADADNPNNWWFQTLDFMKSKGLN